MTKTLIAKPNLDARTALEFPALQALSSEAFAALQERAVTAPGYIEIVMHTKPACVQCNAVKRSLGKFGLTTDQAIDISLDENEALREHLIKVLGIQQAPFTVYGTTQFTGFLPDTVATIAKHRLAFLTSLL